RPRFGFFLHSAGKIEDSDRRRLSLPEIRNKSVSFRAQAINRRRCRNVESAVVLVTPGEICGLFGHDDGAQMTALRIPYPETPWKGISCFSPLTKSSVGSVK